MTVRPEIRKRKKKNNPFGCYIWWNIPLTSWDPACGIGGGGWWWWWTSWASPIRGGCRCCILPLVDVVVVVIGKGRAIPLGPLRYPVCIWLTVFGYLRCLLCCFASCALAIRLTLRLLSFASELLFLQLSTALWIRPLFSLRQWFNSARAQPTELHSVS